MAALQIQNEEQLIKAEGLIKASEIELRDPLLDEAEINKLKLKISRLNAVIQEYREQHPKAEPVPPKTIVLQEAAPQTNDPRPDLTEDAHLWVELLSMAEEKDIAAGRISGEVDTICGDLNGFRCGGTRLRAGRVAGNDMWILKPDIDPTGKLAWTSKAEYDDLKSRYLQRWGTVITELLKELTKRHPVLGSDG